MDSMTGGGREPMILESYVIGGLGEMKSNNGTQYFQQDRVYAMGEVSPCLQAQIPSGSYNFLEEKIIVNPMEDGTCRTIKNQYYKTSVPNFETQSSYGASGVGQVIKIRQADKQGYALCELGGAVDLEYPTSQTRRGRVIENGKICPTLTTENIPNVIELGNEKFYNFVYKIDDEWWLIRIRKLTPRECWRLMGFSDEDFDNASKVNSNTQLYKQAGNSIVVNVLEEIFKQLIGEKE